MVLTFGMGVIPASAARAPMLRIEPALLVVPLGNQVVLAIDIVGGVDVNAFDIMVNYDQQRLALVDWSHGDYLNNLTCLHVVDQPGVLELACTQVARPGVSGDGVLLQLFF